MHFKWGSRVDKHYLIITIKKEHENALRLGWILLAITRKTENKNTLTLGWILLAITQSFISHKNVRVTVRINKRCPILAVVFRLRSRQKSEISQVERQETILQSANFLTIRWFVRPFLDGRQSIITRFTNFKGTPSPPHSGTTSNWQYTGWRLKLCSLEVPFTKHTLT